MNINNIEKASKAKALLEQTKNQLKSVKSSQENDNPVQVSISFVSEKRGYETNTTSQLTEVERATVRWMIIARLERVAAELRKEIESL